MSSDRHSQFVTIQLVHGDILSIDADVVGLKYAQSFYGVDRVIAEQLAQAGVPLRSVPAPGDYLLVSDTRGAIRARQILFVGLQPLAQVNYPEVRRLAEKALEILRKEAPGTTHLAMTIHGSNFGLDEVASAQEQIAGYLSALLAGDFPAALNRISIVERDAERAEALAPALDEILSRYVRSNEPQESNSWRIPVPGEAGTGGLGGVRLSPPAQEPTRKLTVFVAMPFAKHMRDIWRFGIEQTVHKAGMLCERIDQEAFTGDILDQVKQRIESAHFVIADLTGHNPNVFLEVGFAWGKGRPTLLLFHPVSASSELPFDVRGQRCVIYEDATDLEEKLSSELRKLRANVVPAS